MSVEALWQNALKEISKSITQASILSWIKNTQPKKIQNGTLILVVPNQFTKEWLESKCSKIILGALRTCDPLVKSVDFLIAKDPTFTKLISKTKKKELKEIGVEAQLGLIDLDVDPVTNLNPKYTFDNFVVGSFNEMAHACCYSLQTHKNLGSAYNPLFVYGGVGLGKTHLIQAVGNALIKKYKNKLRIKYISAESFMSELVEATKKQKIEDFKKKYRNLDVFIVDDIQFMAGKEKTQIEFFHTFNALYTTNKQIIISSDRPPNAIPALQERLTSRFQGGTIVDITYPEFEARLAILKVKMEKASINLDNEILNYISSNVQKNIRELEGALNKIILHSRTKNIIPSLNEVKKILKPIIYYPKKRISPFRIIEVISEFYELPKEELISGGRKRELVKPRQICMYLLREELKESFPSIGKRMGGRDHTTVIHAYEKVLNEMKEDINLENEINMLKEKLYLS